MSSLAEADRALPETRFRGRIRHFDRVDSTNLVARKLGREGAEDGTVVIADQQTRGYGRRQRRWVSSAGAGLYVSILLRPPFADAESGPAVQLVAGIAVVEALADVVSVAPSLRWPNDCFVNDRKLAGVLVEAETSGEGFDFLVCGIGVNINQVATDFPEELRQQATSVRMQVGHEVPRIEVLTALLPSFDTWETSWRRHGMAPIVERWMELSPQSNGGKVVVRTDAGLVEGVADGLAADGRLRVQAADRLHVLGVGEVVKLRPA
jgi:BirA family biotin operon repressor/biotin-[acetyl-CoA-carboxylase] ligase